MDKEEAFVENQETIVTQPDRLISGESSLARFVVAGTVALTAADYLVGGAVGELSTPLTKAAAGFVIGISGFRGAKVAARIAADAAYDFAVNRPATEVERTTKRNVNVD